MAAAAAGSKAPAVEPGEADTECPAAGTAASTLRKQNGTRIR